ncbi:DUF1549 domain-containing protein [Planctomyces sp. SH-PL62]|uniref:DUF1549 domain-containing protein n=1 Tax=Planctomyces sp. SH-PL62 TaxID=1636152 RepID=UPI00078DB27D|nr:DUF1549 domain-containing protein [Planctomyces sp. SH-PL62]AMV37124.1 hypothetical protein VT85_06810 [Planctomyces sp. SH-PL62]
MLQRDGRTDVRTARSPRRAIAAVAALLVAVSAGARSNAGEEPTSKSADPGKPSPGAANFLDPLLLEAWKEAGLKPPQASSDEEFLRRAYLDLLGRIPTVAEARTFLVGRAPDKRARLVEQLLDHVDFPKNFATEWTNLLIGRGRQDRNVDRAALTAWLRKQFAADRPWNEVVYDLVTASGSNKENGAVNYTLAHMESEAVPLTSRTTRLFLGQQLQCVQCHDHPQNDWKQADFWGVNAFFRGLKAEEKRAIDAAGLEKFDHVELTDVPTDSFARFDRRNGMMGVAFPKFIDGRKLEKPDASLRRVELAKLITDPTSDLLPRAMVNRMWAYLLGRGFVNPVDDIGPHNPAVLPEVFDRLTEEFQASGCDVKQLIRWITSSAAYQATSLRPGKARPEDDLFSVMALRPMSPEQLFDSLLTATAAHRAGSGRDDAKRESWMRQFLFAFGNDEEDEATSFQGTIPQSLMMMNGDLMRDALSGKPGSFLADAVEQAGRQRRSPAAFMVDQLYLAALSRPPTTSERNASVRHLQSYPDALPYLQDLFWALLNSNEFILIH